MVARVIGAPAVAAVVAEAAPGPADRPEAESGAGAHPAAVEEAVALAGDVVGRRNPDRLPGRIPGLVRGILRTRACRPGRRNCGPSCKRLKNNWPA